MEHALCVLGRGNTHSEYVILIACYSNNGFANTIPNVKHIRIFTVVSDLKRLYQPKHVACFIPPYMLCVPNCYKICN
jgi:hypothetical protein